MELYEGNLLNDLFSLLSGLFFLVRIGLALALAGLSFSLAWKVMGRRQPQPEVPVLLAARRQGLAWTSKLAAGLGESGIYRHLMAERLRLVARDILAVEQQLSDEAAIDGLRGRQDYSNPARDFMFSHHLVSRRGRATKKKIEEGCPPGAWQALRELDDRIQS